MVNVTTTYLEMTDPSQLQPKVLAHDRVSILQATTPQWRFNRFLYEAVGADWQWTDKQHWTDAQWQQYVEDPNLRTFGMYDDGSPAGYYELLADETGIEIAYLGLLPAFVGRGLGGPLLTHALQTAWQANPHRVWLHTCTLDHPSAIPNYQARGMVIYKTETSTH